MQIICLCVVFPFLFCLNPSVPTIANQVVPAAKVRAIIEWEIVIYLS
jgi:hypothetical protein